MANNEMQVQQQKIQAHIPQKPTRMKLLYKDHSQPDSAGRLSAMSNYTNATQKQQAAKAAVQPQRQQLQKLQQAPQPNARRQNESIDMSLSQIGIWAPSRASTQPGIASYSNSSFTSSIESMREIAMRTEEATQNRSSGSMLFGPRGMPQQPASRSSNRVQDAPIRPDPNTMQSPYTTISSNDGYGQGDNHSSFVSLYSQSDTGNTMQRSSRAAHEAAISEARQMMDGIPSPLEHGDDRRHEAEYLFDDDCAEDDEYAATDVSKLQMMISPASENSARFVTYGSTVSSRVSSIAESTTSKRLPVIPSTANASIVSDTSSLGLAAQDSSIGDISQYHRSWYSSTESTNLYGGGGLKSVVIDEVHQEEGEYQSDSFAPRTVKNKSRIRPISGTAPKPATESRAADVPGSSAGDGHYEGNYDTRYDIATDFQRAMNLSTNTHSAYGSTTADTRASSSMVDMIPSLQQQNPQMYSMIPPSRQDSPNGYLTANGYMVPVQNGYATNMAPQGYMQPVYSGVDANGRPCSAYQPLPQQQQYQQQQVVYPNHQSQQFSSMQVGGMVAAAPTGGYVPINTQLQSQGQGQGQAQAGYYDPMRDSPSRVQQYPQAVSVAGQRPMSVETMQAGPPMGYMGTQAPAHMDSGNMSAATADNLARARNSATGMLVTAGLPASGQRDPTPSVPAQQPNVHQVSPANEQQQTRSSLNSVPIPTKQDLCAPGSQETQRPASFVGTSDMQNAPGRHGVPSALDSDFYTRSTTPTGFGSVSSAPPSTFAQREGRMSPFPSNVGISQPPTYSANTAMDLSKDMFVENIDPQLAQPLPANVTPINFAKMTRPVFKFGGHISYPESVNWSKVDRQMAMIKSISVKLTADVLATMHVGRPFNKPTERVRAAFIWIASNIQYDPSTAESNDEFERQESPNNVLQRRRSRGPGFAYLFDAMMHALGIESLTIRGYLRQPLDSYQGPVLPAANHVWNAVCLEGEYRLIDTACASKSHPLNAESKVDSWFFLAPPKEMIFTHFPMAASDQFVDPVVPLPVFWMLPYVRPTYFSSKVKLLNLPHVPRIELRDDKVIPLVLCVKDSTLSVFAEVELHDPNGSGRIVARQPLLAQCMDYRGKRMVKILVGVRAADTRGLIKIYCGTRLPLQPKRPSDDVLPQSPGSKAQKMLGFLQNKDKRPSAHDYTRIKDVDEEGKIKTVATSKTFPLACVLPVVHRGRNNAPTFVQLNAAAPNEFYIKEPTESQFHLGESINFHLLPVGDERLFHLQLRSPSGQQHKFVYQPSDQGYILRHTVKERGAWIIVYHTDTDGWLPIASYSCV
ncbi:hypothetical protein GGF37_002299 [Kickxella alabastrina]|nr:hypothetical protein GGF37_002299 [Kickxella alabastrina]